MVATWQLLLLGIRQLSKLMYYAVLAQQLALILYVSEQLL